MSGFGLEVDEISIEWNSLSTEAFHVFWVVVLGGGLHEVEIKRNRSSLRKLLNLLSLVHWRLLLVENVEVGIIIHDVFVEDIVVNLDQSGGIGNSTVGNNFLLFTPVTNVLSILHPLLLAADERLR